MVGIGVGGGSRRSGEEEAGGLVRRQHHPRQSNQRVLGTEFKRMQDARSNYAECDVTA